MIPTHPEADYAPLDEALARLAFGGADLENGMTNHAPMVVEALCALGRPDAVLPWVERYCAARSAPAARRERIERGALARGARPRGPLLGLERVLRRRARARRVARRARPLDRAARARLLRGGDARGDPRRPRRARARRLGRLARASRSSPMRSRRGRRRTRSCRLRRARRARGLRAERGDRARAAWFRRRSAASRARSYRRSRGCPRFPTSRT